MCGSVAKMWRGAPSGEAEAGWGPGLPAGHVFVESMDFITQQYRGGKEHVALESFLV